MGGRQERKGKRMKVNIIFKDGHERKIQLLPAGADCHTLAGAINVAKDYVQSEMKLKLEDVKSYEVEEELIP
jgi:hypothetical protein